MGLSMGTLVLALPAIVLRIHPWTYPMGHRVCLDHPVLNQRRESLPCKN